MFMDYWKLLSRQPAFLIYGLLAACLSSFGQTFYISLFGGELRAAFDLSHGDFGLLYSIATLSSGILLLWLGRSVDRFDLRLVTAAVLLGLATACILLGTAQSLILITLALFGLRLFGQGMMGHLAVTSMGRYFHQARGRAVSIAASGYPLGEAVFPFLAVVLIGLVGWRGSWLIAGIGLLVLGIPLLLSLLRGHGRRRRAWELRQQRLQRDTGMAWTWGVTDVLRDGRFWALLPIVLSPPFFITGFFFHQVHLAEAKDWPLSWLAGAFVVFAFFQVAGLGIAGSLTDRFSARRLLVAYLLPMAAALVLLAVVEARVWVVPYMALLGMSAGAAGTVAGAIWAELYGTRNLGAIRAVHTTTMVFATAGSPWLMGILLDGGITIEGIALVSAGWLVLVTLLGWLLQPALRR